MNKEKCYVENCENVIRTKNLCNKHYLRHLKYKDYNVIIKEYRVPSCKVILENKITCNAKGYSKKMCRKHYFANLRHGDPLHINRIPKNSRKYIYIYVPDHPNAHKDGYIAEHRYVMSNYLNRPLLEKENVHHKNGNGKDNRIENLELWTTMQPSGQRVEDILDFCLDFLKKYAPEKLSFAVIKK